MYNHVKFANFVCTFVLRDIKVYKIRKLHMTVFSTFYDILQPNFTILLNLGCSFQLC